MNTCCILKSILGYQVSDDITDSYERYPRNALPNPDFWHRKFTITYRHLYNGVCPGRSHLTQGRSTYWRDRKRNKYWITVYMHYQTWTNTNVTWRKTKDERRRIWIFTKCIKSHCFNPHFTQNLYRHISKIENNNLPVSDLVRWERYSIYQSRSYVSVRQYSLQSACMHLACTLHAPELKSSNFLYPVCITYTSAIFIRTLTGFIFE